MGEDDWPMREMVAGKPLGFGEGLASQRATMPHLDSG
jgi:hypothetical protein